jgi:hypothetical protein
VLKFAIAAVLPFVNTSLAFGNEHGTKVALAVD